MKTERMDWKRTAITAARLFDKALRTIRQMEKRIALLEWERDRALKKLAKRAPSREGDAT